MATFDFVTDEALRQSLENDARELTHCLEGGSSKAVHVLAGSIVEAVIADHLIASGYTDPNGKDILELDLAQLVTAAKTSKAISTRTADLASVVRSYRNLIHPGRVARLKERITLDTASIANHLVEVVAEEVARQKQSTYGYTAQQLVKKMESDPSAIPILGDLLKGTQPRELEALLVDAIPSRYLELASYEHLADDTVLPRLRRAFRFAIEMAPDTIRRRAAAKYVRVLREDPEFEVKTYESAFFQASDLAYMGPEDAAMAKRHLLAQLEAGLAPHLLDSLIGLGSTADSSDVATIVNAAIRHVLGRTEPSRLRQAKAILDRLWREMPVGEDEQVPNRLKAWERVFELRKNEALKTWVVEVYTAMESPGEIPF